MQSKAAAGFEERNYWTSISGAAPDNDGLLQTSMDADVAIIGGGYTGLSAAYHLAKNTDANVVVLEAYMPGFGCSGRNGGNCRAGLGRMPAGQWIKKWGLDAARRLFDEQQACFVTAKEMIADGKINCDQSGSGWLRIAHRPNRVSTLENSQLFLRDMFGHESELLSGDNLAQHYVRSTEGFGALLSHEAFGINPLKLAFGVLCMARNAGAKVYVNSPVTDWRKAAGRHLLNTPHATVRARRVIIATNGYGDEKVLPALKSRTVPVSSIIGVTRPMTPGELAATNFVTSCPMSDTRHTLFYYRRLPDNRLLMGGRGPVHYTAKSMVDAKSGILRAITRKFPPLSEITLDYFWSGQVCMTLDGLPHISTAEDDPTVFYSVGYNGIGVAQGLHCGRLIANHISGAEEWEQPINLPLPKLPFAAFRTLGLRSMLAWYRLCDIL